MRHVIRKTAPKVRNGQTQRKNRQALSPHYSQTPPGRIVIDRLRPGPGYRHLLKKSDIGYFLDLVPDWPVLSQGLSAIVLAPGEWDTMGWHEPGIIAVCAWDREISGGWSRDFVREHRDVLDRLDVDCVPASGETMHCHFTETSARGFQLMHVLLHELGHHYDRMTTRSQRTAARGEDFAEAYANQYAERLWERYFQVFGW